VISKNHLKLAKSKFVRTFSACPSPWKTGSHQLGGKKKKFDSAQVRLPESFWLMLHFYNFYGGNKLIKIREY
jgi:hypothetical protein